VAVNTAGPSSSVRPTDPRNPDFGPNVSVFDPSTPKAVVQDRLDTIFAEQETNQFGEQRYAVLFKPGSYTADATLGFYTQVAGLGRSPDDVEINGHVRVEADWLQQGADPRRRGNATQNFWRGAENMSVTPPPGEVERWAVSQAAPYRRMHLRGRLQLWNGGDGWASGGMIADSVLDGLVESGSQQQFMTRNSRIGGWSGSVWNMVYVGTAGAPAQTFPNPPNTNVARTPVVREKPFLHVDGTGSYHVFVPGVRENSVGPDWLDGTPVGQSISLSRFFVAKPEDSVVTINAALRQGKNLLFTPGIYHLDETVSVARPGTVVLGLGLATLVPENGIIALSVADVDGVSVAGLLIDAGPVESPVLMEIGQPGSSARHAGDPTSIHDVFFRIGGAGVGKATRSLVVNSSNVIGDHLWLWRADHGTGVGWTENTAANGLVVNGDDVTMYGLFVEHFQQYDTIWNGDGGRTYFYQNEMPYDPPNQAAWSSRPGTHGWASYKVADSVTSHEAWGVGSYSYFNCNPATIATRAFEVPDTPGVNVHGLVTVALGGFGTITHVINNAGGRSDAANHVSYLANYP
jgi:hypothetical protein